MRKWTSVSLNLLMLAVAVLFWLTLLDIDPLGLAQSFFTSVPFFAGLSMIFGLFVLLNTRNYVTIGGKKEYMADTPLMGGNNPRFAARRPFYLISRFLFAPLMMFMGFISFSIDFGGDLSSIAEMFPYLLINTLPGASILVAMVFINLVVYMKN